MDWRGVRNSGGLCSPGGPELSWAFTLEEPHQMLPDGIELEQGNGTNWGCWSVQQVCGKAEQADTPGRLLKEMGESFIPET